MLASTAIAACVALKTSSMQQDATALDITSYDFGMVPLGMVASGGPFTIKPANASSVMDDDYVTKISFASSCPDFGLVPSDSQMTVAADGSLDAAGTGPHIYWNCTTSMFSGSQVTTCNPVTWPFSATFKTSNTAPQQCGVIVQTKSGSGAGSGSNFLTLSGQGMGSSYSISSSTSFLDFGTVHVGSASAGQVVTITNTGTSNVTVTNTIDVATAYSSSPAFGNSFTLGGSGSNVPYTITCTPPAPSTYTTMLHYTTPAAQGGLDVPVMVTCTGANTTVSVTPNPIKFGSNLIGAAMKTQAVQISAGSGSVTLSNFTFKSSPPRITYQPQPGSATLGSGMTVTVTVAYDPSAEDSSGSLGAMQFDASGTTITVPITGTALLGSIGTTPASVDFGGVCAGGSGAVDVTVTTNAAGDVNVSSFDMPATPFAATTTDIPKLPLPGNGMGSIVLHTSVAPGAAATPGPISSKVTLHTNIPGGMLRDIPLTATVLPAGVTPTPASLSFGPVMVHTNSAGMMVVVTNCSGGDLVITDGRLTGAAATDFSIEAPANYASLNKTLHDGESQMFAVQMSPTSTGDKQAKLVVDFADSSFKEIPLDGTSYDNGSGSGSGSNSAERQTYYACSTGHAVELWPIALACAWLARRRRRR